MDGSSDSKQKTPRCRHCQASRRSNRQAAELIALRTCGCPIAYVAAAIWDRWEAATARSRVSSPSANKRKADFPAVLPERRFVPRFVAGVGLLFLTDRE